MRAECLQCSSAAAWLDGELPADEQAAFERHLSTCADCRARVDSTRLLLGQLRSVPQLEGTRDLAPGILDRIRKEPLDLPRPVRWQRVAAIAAILAVLAGGALTRPFQNAPAPANSALALADDPSASVGRALDWFCRNQEPDGSWDPGKWGGNRRFEVALTALPLIALLESEPTH